MIYRFDNCALDTQIYQLSLSGESVSVEPLVFDLLVYLIEHRGRVVTREELLDNLWKGKVVTDAALGARLKDARRAVGDSGSRQEVIKTLHGRGYQFIAALIENNKSPESHESDEIDSPVDLSLPDNPSIAVLPFSNLTGNSDHEVLCDGLTDDIITILSRVPGLFVIARHSVLTYKNQAIDVKRVGQEQGVAYVLEGSVQAGGNRIRISAQLIDATTGHHCWAERFDSTQNDFFKLQDDISRKVVVALQVTLTEGAQARMSPGGTTDLIAWENTQLAKRLLEKHIREENMEAQQLLIEAVQRDPEYASAWAYLGWTQWENHRWAWANPEEESLDQAAISAEKALEIDQTNPDGLALLGMLHMTRGDLDKSIKAIEQGVSLYPSHAFLLAMSAIAYRGAGKSPDGIRRILRAIRHCPIFPSWYLMVLGSLYFFNHEPEQAIKILKEAVSREPDSNLSRIWLVNALIESRMIKEAQITALEILKIEPNFSSSRWVDSIVFKDPVMAPRLSANLSAVDLPE